MVCESFELCIASAHGRPRGLPRAGYGIPMRLGAKRKMFSWGSEEPVLSVAGACTSPFPFVRTFCSAAGSEGALVRVSSAAAASAACRRVLAPDIVAALGDYESQSIIENSSIRLSTRELSVNAAEYVVFCLPPEGNVGEHEGCVNRDSVTGCSPRTSFVLGGVSSCSSN